jgi:hypothetical protein
LAIVGMLMCFIVVRVAGYFALLFKLRHIRWASRYSFILLFHLSFICVVHRTIHPLLINKKKITKMTNRITKCDCVFYRIYNFLIHLENISTKLRIR